MLRDTFVMLVFTMMIVFSFVNPSNVFDSMTVNGLREMSSVESDARGRKTISGRAVI